MKSSCDYSLPESFTYLIRFRICSWFLHKPKIIYHVFENRAEPSNTYPMLSKDSLIELTNRATPIENLILNFFI